MVAKSETGCGTLSTLRSISVIEDSHFFCKLLSQFLEENFFTDSQKILTHSVSALLSLQFYADVTKENTGCRRHKLSMKT